ncbi:MAG: hypothetical protein L3J03_10585 [Desulfobacterales bacterium]|nr:hypothetical protein [Desulfobacterales bacterium]
MNLLQGLIFIKRVVDGVQLRRVTLAAALLVLFPTAGLPATAAVPAASEYYTVQVGSYDAGGAQRNYALLEQYLTGDDLDHLRIEKVNGFHTVRIGRFVDPGPARLLLEKVSGRYSSALVLSAYLKNERITRIYQGPEVEVVATPAVSVDGAPEKPERPGEPEKAVKAVKGPAPATKDGGRVESVAREKRKTDLFAKPLFVVDRDDSGDPLGIPMGMFYDRFMKELYVSAGFRGNRVLVYGADYFPLLSLGPGRGIGSPRGLAVDRQGRLFLCQQPDSNHPYGRLSILNPAMLPEREIVFDGSHGLGGNGSFLPVRVALGRNEKIIYLVGNKGAGVYLFDITGKYLRHLNVPRSRVLTGGSELTPGLAGRAPEFVAINDVVITGNPGRIYLLSDEVDRVIVYDTITEEFLFAFGLGGGSYGKLSRPRGIAVDEKRQLVYVVDYMRHAVLIYSLEGEFLHEFGGIGSTPGVFSYPNGIAVDADGHVIVSEMSNQRLQVFEVIER